MHGFFNRLLRVDLSNRTYGYEELSDALLSRTLGGKGLGTHLLWEENAPGVDPLAPEAAFIITTGPVTGTKMWSQSRFGVYAKSPATGGYGESYCGGALAPKIKATGVDAIVITGAADALTHLVITDEGVEFSDAGDLAGAETFAAEDAVLASAPEGAGAMTIGPAGEHLVAQACVKVNKWRSIGRGGMGAVLGSKMVKGIAFSGSAKCPVADPERLTRLIKSVAAAGKASPVTGRYQQFGTIMQVAVINGFKCFPNTYWSSGRLDGWESLSGEYMLEHFDVKKNGCPNCFLQCTKYNRVREGRHAGLELDGPEYETVYALGGLNGIDSLEEVAWLNVICDKLGLDTMSAGNMTAFAIEAYKRGKSDFEIDYNQPDKVAELLEMIAHRRGIGAVLAKGIKEAAREWDLEDIAVHVKGLEPAGFDPRVFKGMGLTYAVSARGACHLRGTFYKAEQSGEIDPAQIEGKAELMIDYEDRSCLLDTMILCRFFRDLVKWDELSELIAATTGLELTKEQLQSIANDITQKTRAYNLREGITRDEDRLPTRIVREATKEGNRITEQEISELIADYNRIRESRSEALEAAR
ncbi:MAG: aldehyde ferredoxin oxidoreductase family protein [Spirochaetaceae bacterium]